MITQGRGDGAEWVSEYLVSYSPDGEKWSYVTDNSEIARVSNEYYRRLFTKIRLSQHNNFCPENVFRKTFMWFKCK